MAAPTKPIDDRTPVSDRPAGAVMSEGSISPSVPTSPGMTELTASMSACQAAALPESHRAAIENPRSTAAKTANKRRYVMLSASIGPRCSE